MTYNLVFSVRAQRDLQRATDSIPRDAPDTAVRWFNGFIATLQTLSKNATVFGLAPESEHCAFELRQILYRTKSRRANRALYILRDETVYVLAIRRPGEDLLTDDELAAAIADLD